MPDGTRSRQGPDPARLLRHQARPDRQPSARPSPGLIALQDKILGLLGPGGPASTLSAGRPADPARYFADLQALGAAGLLDLARGPAPEPLARDSGGHRPACRALRQRTADRQSRSRSSKSRATSGPPPTDAAASAGLAHIADHILLSGGPGRGPRTTAPAAPRQHPASEPDGWGLRVVRSTTSCSEGLQAACTPLLRGFTKIGGQPQARRNAVSARSAGDPRTSRRSCPKDWYDRHFKPINGVNPMFTRRTAALRLVQMVAGGSLGEAAGFLGIAATGTTWPRKSRIYSGAGHVHSSARKQPDPLAFEAALQPSPPNSMNPQPL